MIETPSRRARRAVTLCVAAVVLLSAPAASADTLIQAQTVWRFDAASYTLAQGAKLTFENHDAASPGPHNVTSTQTGSDNKPLFQTPSIPNGGRAAAAGASQLKPGQYAFLCTVHPFMQATLVVNGSAPPPAGSAPTPPGSGPPPPGPSPASPPPARRTPTAPGPLVRVGLAGGSLRAKRLFAVIRSDRSVALVLSLTARARGLTTRIGTARARDARPGQSVRFAITLTVGGRHLLRGLRRAVVALTVRATDAAGRSRVVTSRALLRR
ncbi:MAG TPA: hypothetical protein VGN69_03670 [Solirubrobacteraceae bacterium]|jgi:plastocyanin|nr:hypothetical protein [Solirubrobacteraceae bacterium]